MGQWATGALGTWLGEETLKPAGASLGVTEVKGHMWPLALGGHGKDWPPRLLVPPCPHLQ